MTLSPTLYTTLKDRLVERGFGGDVEWAQGITRPETPEDLAAEAAFVILNSGMKNTVATRIWEEKVRPRLWEGLSVRQSDFGHPGKRKAINGIWKDRRTLWRAFMDIPSDDNAAQLAFCRSLPWIGPITQYHLAKNLGVDCAKPDRWLERVANVSGETVDGLCARLAAVSGDRIGTVDVVIWRACAVGLLLIENDRLVLCKGTES